MNRTVSRVALVGLIGVIPVLTGCNDKLKAKDAQIAMMENTNQQLADDLAAARRDNTVIARQRDDLSGQVAAFSGRVDDLNAQLAAKPEPVPVTEGWQAVPGGAMIAIEGAVLFAPGKPALRPEGKSTLDVIVAAIRSEYGEKDVFVFGHTDNEPIRKSGWADNFELSTQRALSVVRYLRDRGLSPASLIACGAGEHRPVASNDNDVNRARNRRVEIFAVNPINR